MGSISNVSRGIKDDHIMKYGRRRGGGGITCRNIFIIFVYLASLPSFLSFPGLNACMQCMPQLGAMDEMTLLGKEGGYEWAWTGLDREGGWRKGGVG